MTLSNHDLKGEMLVPGAAEGRILKLTAPVSFWGGVDPATGEIIAGGHPQRGLRVEGTILAIPAIIGSSGTSSVILELLHAGIGPVGVILGRRDAILPLGVVIAEEMGHAPIPVVSLPSEADYDDLPGDGLVRILSDGRIEADGRIAIPAPI